MTKWNLDLVRSLLGVAVLLVSVEIGHAGIDFDDGVSPGLTDPIRNYDVRNGSIYCVFGDSAGGGSRNLWVSVWDMASGTWTRTIPVDTGDHDFSSARIAANDHSIMVCAEGNLSYRIDADGSVAPDPGQGLGTIQDVCATDRVASPC